MTRDSPRTPKTTKRTKPQGQLRGQGQDTAAICARLRAELDPIVGTARAWRLARRLTMPVQWALSAEASNARLFQPRARGRPRDPVRVALVEQIAYAFCAIRLMPRHRQKGRKSTFARVVDVVFSVSGQPVPKDSFDWISREIDRGLTRWRQPSVE